MLEILRSCWELLVGLTVQGWDLLSLVIGWGCEILYHLHTSAPRLEGLLVGILLAWLMLRRNKHPLLRVLSAPLKLVVDVLDLAWDQTVEVVRDLWSTVRDWVKGAWNLVLSPVKRAYSKAMEVLGRLKERLSSKKE